MSPLSRPIFETTKAQLSCEKPGLWFFLNPLMVSLLVRRITWRSPVFWEDREIVDLSAGYVKGEEAG
jgi:hypothetical protein